MEEQALQAGNEDDEKENLAQAVQVFSWESLAAKLVQIIKDLS